MLVDMDNEKQTSTVSLRAHQVLAELQAENPDQWRTEYANYMVEGVAAPPFAFGIDECINEVEESMKKRRERLFRFGDVVSMVFHPTLGMEELDTCGPLSRSLFLPDRIT